MLNKLTLILIVVFTNLLFTQATLASDTNKKIEQILSLKEAPTGIVFEIVTALDISIVTHGDEQFALKTTNNKKFKKVHSLTQQLAKEDNIPLHVCGTYASWKNVEEEEFPDYVDVTAAGPATINDYISLGYILIKL